MCVWELVWSTSIPACISHESEVMADDVSQTVAVSLNSFILRQQIDCRDFQYVGDLLKISPTGEFAPVFSKMRAAAALR